MGESGQVLPDLLSKSAFVPRPATQHSSLESENIAISRSVAKRLFDVVGSALLILLTAPVFLLIALVLLCSSGTVFYAHQRIGAGRKPFRCLKFRTMVSNGDQILAAKLVRDPAARAEWEAKRKLVDDPRVTKVGRMLRTTSLDELPQLINVLKGDMSIVGPRPIVQEEEVKYGDDLNFYLAVRPGITGLWQVSGRSNTSFEQRVALDRSYVEEWRLCSDFVMILRTIPVLLGRGGAF